MHIAAATTIGGAIIGAGAGIVTGHRMTEFGNAHPKDQDYLGGLGFIAGAGLTGTATFIGVGALGDRRTGFGAGLAAGFAAGSIGSLLVNGWLTRDEPVQGVRV